jgi:7,8-dihydropterin-6-yl-methyl-4-(beta-D-ribofuranosyl)aminobenzene 5'-phosphate synthase
MKLTCVVDNTVDHASPLWGEHGLAFALETSDGKILFDAGQSGKVLLHNLGSLNVKPADFKAVVSSHAHHDHTGGLLAFLDEASGPPLFAHADFFRRRYATRKKKAPRLLGPAGGRKELRKLADLHLSAEATQVLPGLWTSGEIRKRAEPEGRSPRHVVRLKDGSYVPDPYRDDLSLVWDGDAGLVVILGCAHAGVLNILAQVVEDFRKPIKTVVGGMHLHGAEPSQIEHVAATLADVYGAPTVYPNHCTGMAGFLGLYGRLGDRVKPCPVGTVLEF